MKPKLYKQSGYWVCVCERGIMGISDDIQRAYTIWQRQTSTNAG